MVGLYRRRDVSHSLEEKSCRLRRIEPVTRQNKRSNHAVAVFHPKKKKTKITICNNKKKFFFNNSFHYFHYKRNWCDIVIIISFLLIRILIELDGQSRRVNWAALGTAVRKNRLHIMSRETAKSCVNYRLKKKPRFIIIHKLQVILQSDLHETRR